MQHHVISCDPKLISTSPGDPELLGLPGDLPSARQHGAEAPLQGQQLFLSRFGMLSSCFSML